MNHHQVIIIGGGPAGAACAEKLVQAGMDTLVLDKSTFPRKKTCAGWITPQVFQDLNLKPEDYPNPLSSYPGLQIYLKGFPVNRPGRQYAIRRVEFDDWLLKRSSAQVVTHQVQKIQQEKGSYQIDGQFAAEYLVGAGGTHCPVYHTIFRDQHPRKGNRIAALETEFSFPFQDDQPKLWFFDQGLPGYAWYLPKDGGYLNVGVGGNAQVLKERGKIIQDYWVYFLNKLKKRGLISGDIPDPKGYVYFLRGNRQSYRIDNAFLVGDAAGLSSLDMGEGIGPAIQSGQRAADSILQQSAYSLDDVSRFSLLPRWLRWLISS